MDEPIPNLTPESLAKAMDKVVDLKSEDMVFLVSPRCPSNTLYGFKKKDLVRLVENNG